MIASFQGSFGIDKHVRDVLDVAHLPLPTANLQEGIIGSRSSVGRIEQQDATMPSAEARGQIPVLAFYVMDNATTRPGQKGRNDKANPFPASGRSETQDVLRSIMPEVIATKAPEHDAILAQELRRPDLGHPGPMRRAIGCGRLRLARSPDRHCKSNDHRNDTARCCNAGALQKYSWRVGVIRVPPPEKRGWRIDGHPTKRLKPRWA